jgi:hypothetical protein
MSTYLGDKIAHSILHCREGNSGGNENPFALIPFPSAPLGLYNGLCLAKTKSAYEINNIHRCRVTCYMDEECLVRSLGEEQPYPIAFS